MAHEQRTVVGRLLTWLNVLAANAAAVLCVMVFVNPGLLEFATVPGQRVLLVPLESHAAWGVFIGGICLLVLNLVWLARRPRAEPPRNYIVSDAPGGSVRITRDALEGGLRAAGEALDEITRLRVLVDTTASKRVVVHGQFQCPEGVSNLEASRALRQALMRRFDDMVRLADGARVEFDIEFVGFAGKLQRRGAEERTVEPEPAPFTGPQYPIDGEEGR